ncbi:hypothetical protein EJB05_08847, partial [Eragrostis curvula]
MKPAIFKALLHFMYTDSLPSMDSLSDDENKEAIKHLLVAADRYDMERMKLMCESILARSLDVDCVADTLALADQYHCNKLKDACIEFINSSNTVADVQASRGYPHLKRAHPSVFVEIWERTTKSRKIYLRCGKLGFPQTSLLAASVPIATHRALDSLSTRSIPEASRATHVFKVAGYRLQKGLDQGEFVRSATFSVGGFDWCVRYYPHGHKGGRDQVSVYLELQSMKRWLNIYLRLQTGMGWNV